MKFSAPSPTTSILLITLALLPLAYIVAIAVLFFPGFDSQLKGVVVGAIMGAACLGAVTGHWLNDVAKRTNDTTTTGATGPTGATGADS